VPRNQIPAAVLLLLAFAPVASAAPRITIGPVRNDPKAAIPAQLAKSLCSPFQCVLWPEVSSKGQVDFAKAKAAGVAGVLSGAVARTDASATLTLWLFTSSTKPARTWTFLLTTAGVLKADAMARIEKDLGAALQSTAPAPSAAPAAAAATAGVASSPPPPEPALFAPATRPPPEPSPSPAATPAAAAVPSAKAPGPVTDRWFLAGELGLFVMQRKLSYSGVTPSTGTLLGFDASSITGPVLRVELFPAGRGGSTALAGLGLFGAYEASVGLKTLAPSGEERPTAYARLQLGAAWRSPALAGHVVLVPNLSWQSLKLTVSPPIDGLPDTDLSGVKVGLDAEVALGDRVVLLAGAGWVDWMTAKELIKGSPPYFPAGSAWALDADLGVGVRMWRSISLRLLGEYSSTSYTLKAEPGGAYQATGAEDRYLGARAVVRATW
jgi:hypothetical protein